MTLCVSLRLKHVPLRTSACLTLAERPPERPPMAVGWRVSFAPPEKGVLSSRAACDPPGYDASLVASTSGARAEDAVALAKRRQADLALKQAHAWGFAKSPAGQLPMVCFMMWMAGSGVQIFSIMITLTNVASPVRAIISSGAAFKRFEEPGVDALLPRLLFCAVHCCTLLFALYKLDKMGLLPTHASDWLPSAPPLPQLEMAYSGL